MIFTDAIDKTFLTMMILFLDVIITVPKFYIKNAFNDLTINIPSDCSMCYFHCKWISLCFIIL